MTLTSSDLEYMRGCVEELLPSTGNILSRTLTPDGEGGNTESWGTATASVACRIDPGRGRQMMIGQSIQPFYGFIATLPHDTTITSANRFESGGYTYAVIEVDNGKSWDVSKRALLEVI